MFQQEGKARRKPLVYGKAKSSSNTYHSFDFGDSTLDIPRRNQGAGGEEQADYGPGKIITTVEIPLSRKLHSTRRITPLKKERAPSPSSHHVSPERHENRGEQTSFDIPSSDEETPTVFEKSMQKRRRLTPVGDKNTTTKGHRRDASRSNLKGGDSSSPAQVPAVHSHSNSDIISKRTRTVHHGRSREPKTPSPEGSVSTGRSTPARTPNQTRLLSGILDPTVTMDSPSKLPITSLTLAGNGKAPPVSLKSTTTQANLKRVAKSRKRLIDVMASPAKPVSEVSSGSGSVDLSSDDTKSTTSPDEKAALVSDAPRRNPSAVEASSQSHDETLNPSGSARITTAKPRMTYSKERSHLSEMAIEEYQGSNSQVALNDESLESLQRKALLSSFDSIDPDGISDSEGEQDSGGIRSIHELRQAGSSARSRVDIEALLDDIEAKGTSARARRLRGILLLSDKLVSAEMSRELLELDLETRLVHCPCLRGDDLVGQTLLALLFSRLLTSAELSRASLKGVFDALLPSGLTLLHETRDLKSLARDRKQNISKSNIKDIDEIARKYRSSPLWDRKPKSPSPQMIYVKFLDLVLRQARQRGDFDMILPAPAFKQLITILLDMGTHLDSQLEDASSAILMVEIVVSVIESLTISQNWGQDGCLLVAKQLSHIGSVLNQVRETAGLDPNHSQHLILRLILNITNNDPSLCDNFSEPTLLRALWDIVQKDFIRTFIRGENVLSSSSLESVILALGALGNLAEHSHLFRQRMMEESTENKKLVDWVASTFRDQVDAASEVRISPLPFFPQSALVQHSYRMGRYLLSSKQLLLSPLDISPFSFVISVWRIRSDCMSGPSSMERA